MKKYGLQLRVPSAQKSSKPPPPRAPPPAFAFSGDDEDDIEREISRQASKNKALQKIEEQHKKAMEEDPSVFDYDGVYDEMKEQMVRPKIQDRTERKSKYVETLMAKAKQREREHEIVYEKKLLKERSKDDHLYADKEKFVTSAYKKKLAEQAKWLEEERLRQIREEREDVTKKSDLSEFYFGLRENVAFGARSEEATELNRKRPKDTSTEVERGPTETDASTDHVRNGEKEDARAKISAHTENNSGQDAAGTKSNVPVKHASGEGNGEGEQQSSAVDTTANERYKRTDDALAAARERFLARKRARKQL